jgi:4-carboxymuconolactone decarboxylase
MALASAPHHLAAAMTDHRFQNRRAEEIVDQLFPHGAGRLAQLERLDPAFARYLEDVVYGGLYARDVLDQRTRELCALAALTVIGRPAQIRVHILAALRAGATRAEVQEVIFQVTTYAGLPASLGGLEVMEQVWRDLDAGSAPPSGAPPG